MKDRAVLVLLLALFAAGAAACVLGLVGVWAGWDMRATSPRIAAVFAALFFAVAGLGLGRLLDLDVQHQIRLDDMAIQERRARLAPVAVAQPDTQPQVTVLRQVPINSATGQSSVEVSETRPASWLAWRLAFLDGFAWARRLENNVTSPAMLRAGAFKRAEDWQAWADAMQLNGWLSKSPGIGSVLTTTTAAMRSQVLAGEFEHPSGLPPTIAPIPGPSVTIPALHPSGEVAEQA